MRCRPSRRGLAPAWSATALFAALLIALVGPGCTPELCTRHSECPVGYQCSLAAQCERLPDAGAAGGDGGVVVPGQPDGGVVIGDLPDGGGDDAGEPDAALFDAAVDPDASAGFDASVDAAPAIDAAEPPLAGQF